jgi:hypothetical protein
MRIGMTTNADSEIEAGRSTPSRGFVARVPLPNMVQRWFAFASLALLGVVAVEFGFFFKHTFDLYDHAEPPLSANYRHDVGHLLAFGQVALVVAMVALSLWTAFAVKNAQRVFHSLRSMWFGVGGWVLIPVIAYGAHRWLDQTMRSGWVITGVVSLAVMYVPHGTIGGTAKDLGGSSYFARVWYILMLLAGILMWAALAGTSHGMPGTDPQSAMKVKAFLCFVSALLLFAAAASYYATAQHINELTHHKWVDATTPKGVLKVAPGAVAVTRPADYVPKPPIPTHALRAVVWCGFFVLNIAAVATTFGVRRRAIRAEVRDGTAAAHKLLVSATNSFNHVIVIAVVVHVMYMAWGIAAAVNARRRTLMAPNPWGVAAAFLGGAVFLLFTSTEHSTFATTMLAIVVGVNYVGFIIGQLLLGRSAVALGGSGRLFLSWLIAEFGIGSCIAYLSRVARDDAQLVTFGGVLAGFAVASSVIAWLAMTRLDHACGTEASPAAARESVDAAADAANPLQRLLSRPFLTSSHS